MSIFDKFMGLPVHPLVDHFAVVLFPLALLMLLAIIAVRPWRARFGWLTIALLTLGTAAVLAAKESGEQLARHIGEPHDHALYADILTWVSLVTWVAALVWFVVDRGAHLQARRASAASGQIDHRAKPAPSAFRGILAGITAVGSLVSLVLVALVGHTGAKATWGATYATAPADTPSASTTPTPSTSPSASMGPSSNAPSGSPSNSPSNSPSSPTADASSSPSDTGSPTTSTSATDASASPTASGSASSAASFTLAQVATHNSTSDCWAAIDGSVYNLTDWINQHPGGPGNITALCGTDGSAKFNAQHGSDTQAQQQLAQFKVGTLA